MVSKKLWKNIKFLKEINEFFKENKNNLIDIILFGSTIKGKKKPKDIDLLILFKDKKDLDLSYKLRKNLEKKNFKVEITSKTYKELFSPLFKVRESILSEGFSLIQKKFLSKGFGYINLILFKYNLKKFNKSDRMRFYYSLHGRGKEKGMLKKLNTIKFSKTILLSPIEYENELKYYLEKWSIEYIKFPILMPNRIKNIL